MLSTAVMVRLGRVYDNWMIDVAQSNKKLQERGLRIAAEASGASVSEAAQALRQSGYNLRIALVMLKGKCSLEEARARLSAARNNLRSALKE
jgi:N-acetylmuramic acid 6-phosphate etherase